MGNESQNISGPQLSEHKDVTRFVHATRSLIKYIAIGLPLVFTWLTLNDISIESIDNLISNTTATDVVWKSALILFFTSWIWGTSYDTDMQELVYLSAPKKGQLPLHAIGVSVMIAIVMSVLLWVPDYQTFTLVLILFWLINLIAWRYLVWFIVGSMIASSEVTYRENQDYFGLEKLKIVENYICGRWQWWRFIFGGILCLAMIVLAISPQENYFIPVANISVSQSFIHSMSIFLFVTLMETWIWVVRIKSRVSIDVLDDFRNRYSIQRK